jgi:hypothetical protein
MKYKRYCILCILFIKVYVLLGATVVGQEATDSSCLYKQAYKYILRDLKMKSHDVEVSDTIIDLNSFFAYGKFESKEMNDKILHYQNSPLYNNYYSSSLSKMFKKRNHWKEIIFFSRVNDDGMMIAEVYFADQLVLKTTNYRKLVSVNMMCFWYSYLFQFSGNKIIKTIKGLMNE